MPPNRPVWNQYLSSYIMCEGGGGYYPTNGNVNIGSGIAAFIGDGSPEPPLSGSRMSPMEPAIPRLYSEHSLAAFSSTQAQQPGSLVMGGYPIWQGGATGLWFDCNYPPNPPQLVTSTVASNFGAGIVFSTTAGSSHPGGVNCAFADGSVHFIKNSIGCWAGQGFTGPSQGRMVAARRGDALGKVSPAAKFEDPSSDSY